MASYLSGDTKDGRVELEGGIGDLLTEGQTQSLDIRAAGTYDANGLVGDIATGEFQHSQIAAMVDHHADSVVRDLGSVACHLEAAKLVALADVGESAVGNLSAVGQIELQKVGQVGHLREGCIRDLCAFTDNDVRQIMAAVDEFLEGGVADLGALRKIDGLKPRALPGYRPNTFIIYRRTAFQIEDLQIGTTYY